MSKKLGLLLAFLFVFAYQTKASDVSITDTFTCQGRYYFYKITQKESEPQFWGLEVYSTFTNKLGEDDIQSNIVFRTDLELKRVQGRISLVKVFLASPVQGMWTVYPTNHLRVSFMWDKMKVYYLPVGDKLKDPNIARELKDSEMVESFAAAGFDEAAAFRIAVTEFTKRYESVFVKPMESSKVAPTREHKGNMTFNQKNYEYTVFKDFFSKDESNIVIRMEDYYGTNNAKINRQVFNSLIKIVDERSTKKRVEIYIHSSELEGLSWGILAKEYLLVTFDANTQDITYAVVGEQMRTIYKMPRMPYQAQYKLPEGDISMPNAVDIALQYFIANFNKLFFV
ncbi:MAG: hypothetical protein EAZ57_10600 [Cytophagales bacterium]|nr:MAG: hypothetical protein EAZ67_10875 [Cytophagales bacterium]TAF59605.1 MAG: hypothetical protein EAZ57_10600 [Cytophagales bacterium]